MDIYYYYFVKLSAFLFFLCFRITDVLTFLKYFQINKSLLFTPFIILNFFFSSVAMDRFFFWNVKAVCWQFVINKIGKESKIFGVFVEFTKDRRSKKRIPAIRIHTDKHIEFSLENIWLLLIHIILVFLNLMLS